MQHTNGFGGDSVPFHGVWPNKPYFQTSHPWYPAPPKKPIRECSQRDAQWNSHHGPWVCSSQAWESPSCYSDQRENTSPGKAVVPLFPMWSQEAILALGIGYQQSHETFSLLTTACIWSHSWTWEKVSTGVCPWPTRGLMPPVLCVTSTSPWVTYGTGKNPRDMNAVSQSLSVCTSPLFLPSSLFCLFLFRRKAVLKQERPN